MEMEMETKKAKEVVSILNGLSTSKAKSILLTATQMIDMSSKVSIED
jgi:ribosomal protein L22